MDCHCADAAPAQRRGFVLLLSILVLIATGKAVLFDTMDPDLFWHLRVGQQLCALPFPRPIVDSLSFSSMRQPWTPYSWLAEIGMYRLWTLGGFRAAVLAQALLASGFVIFMAMGALEMTIAKHGKPRYLLAIVAAITGEFLSLPYISFRPVTIAMFFLAVAAWLIQRDRRMLERSRGIWWLVPLTLLTTNVHLFAFFLPASVAAFFAGAIREWKIAQDKIEPRRRMVRYGWLLLGVSLAYLATPMLPGVIASAFAYQFHDVLVNSTFIAEMRPFWWGTMGPVAVVFVIAVILSTLSKPRLLRVGEWLWLAGSVAVLLRLGRFAPIFAIFAAPMLAACAPRLSDRVLSRPLIQYACCALLCIAGVRIARSFPARDMTLTAWLERLGPDCPGYPTESCDYVASHVSPATHRLIGEFTWGGYLEYRLGGDYQVFMDGRSQIFPASFWKAIYLGTPQTRRAYLAHTLADVAVLPRYGSPFRDDLLSLGWTLVHTDARAQVLVAPQTQMASDR